MPNKIIEVELTTSFYKQLIVVGSIGVCSILGFKYLGDLIEEKIDSKMSALISQATILKAQVDLNTNLLAVNTSNIQINSFCLENFIQYYNKTHNKEFILPSQLRIETENSKPKKNANTKTN
jgi:hypothetical protein